MPEVFFCNLCDQSVPMVEVEDGAAVRAADRVLCRQCRSLLEGAAPAGRRAGAWLALVFLVAAVGLAAAGVALYQQRRDRQWHTESLGVSARQWREEVASVRALAETSSERAAGERALLASQLNALRDELGQRAQDTSEKLAALEASLAALNQIAADVEALRAGQGRAEASLTLLEERQRALRAAQDSLRDQVVALHEEVQQRVQEAQKRAASPEATFSPEVASLLRQLQHEDGRVRYDALEKLEKLQDPRLLPHVYPLLADPYEFVRFLAARLLGEWEARPAVPHLIEALLDEKNFVREAASWALRRITLQNIPFDKDAPEAARRQAYGAWKAWWAENGEEFLRAES